MGNGAMTNSIGELDEMGLRDCIFAIGTNTTECHPIIGLGMMRAKHRGAKLIVADPRAITLSQHADLWLRLKPGTDAALLNGIAHVILEEGMADEDFIAARTENFEAFRDSVQRFTPEIASAITTVPAEDIRRAARLIGNSENTATYYTMGITQHTSGVDNVLAVANLAFVTGNIGKPKAGVNPLRGQNNVQGSCDMGALPNTFPGYQKVTDAAVRQRFEQAWGVSLSGEPGRTIPGVFDGIESGAIRALYVFGENPMRSDPDVNHVEHCLDHVDFLIVQDIFLTETAQKADVVLPGASFAEKDGTFSSTERRVQRIRKAIEPVGDSRPDWRIIMELMQAMGYDADYASPEDVFDEMRSVTPTYAGISYARLEQGGIQWPCWDDAHPGTPVLHVGQCDNGRGQFSAIDHRDPAEMPDEEYPLMLTTGRVVAHYHTGTMTRRCWGLNGLSPEESLEINPADAEELGLEHGDPIVVTTRRGEVRTKAQVTPRVPKGLTFITFHFSEACGNILTNSAADPVTETAELKVCAVRVRKDTASDSRVVA
jgi:formate dehydrogenase major subunit